MRLQDRAAGSVIVENCMKHFVVALLTFTAALGGCSGQDQLSFDPKARETGDSPKQCLDLFKAINSGNFTDVKGSLEVDAEPNCVDERGWPAIVVAAHQGNHRIVETLLEHGADVDAKTPDGWSALLAASGHHSAVVCSLLERGADPNQIFRGDLTPLTLALKDGNGHAAQCLLEHGANPNLCTDDGWTPLMRALIHKDVLSASLLCSASANVNAKTLDGWTALHQSVGAGEDAVNLMVKVGAGINVLEKGGRTPLFLAVEQGNHKVTQILLENQADPNLISHPTLWSPLCVAAHSKESYLLALLLKHGAEVDGRGEMGWTPLMLAVANNDVKCVSVLLANDSDPTVKNDDGKTAIDVAKDNGREDFVRLLSPYAMKH